MVVTPERLTSQLREMQQADVSEIALIEKKMFPDPWSENLFHDCFRLAEHPRICDGEHIVRFKLLTPKNRKIDYCDDWPTFKQREYPRIRKDLLAKFPGVGWV